MNISPQTNQQEINGTGLMAIRSRIYDLKSEKEALNDKKRLIEVQLKKTKNLVRSSGIMPRAKYQQCCDAQSKYSEQIQVIEKRLGQLKIEIQRLADAEDQHPEKSRNAKTDTEAEPLGKECVRSLVALREKYQSFSADHTRVASMRTMAAEFAIELSSIIKAALK